MSHIEDCSVSPNISQNSRNQSFLLLLTHWQYKNFKQYMREGENKNVTHLHSPNMITAK